MSNLITAGDVSNRIHRALRATARNRRWLSDATNIPYSTLSRRLQKDPNGFTLGELFKVAEALDTSVHELVAPDYYYDQ